MLFFVPRDLDLLASTLPFRLIQAKDQTRLPCEFVANPFSSSRDISYTNKTNAKDFLPGHKPPKSSPGSDGMVKFAAE